nr:hypothetical protein [Tanacetum cinerariifolium]
MIVAGSDNRLPMLEKSMYNSWPSHMLLYIKGKEHGRIMLNFVLEGPLVYGTIEVNGVTRLKTYEELSDKEKLDDCDLRAMNIVLQGLPPDVYPLVNHHQVAKQIWDQVKFLSVKNETLHEYYLRFAQLMNDMHTIGMTMQPVQVNTKFLNSLPPEWSKFVTDVKLAKDMHESNYDQLYAYLSQHEAHAIEVRVMREMFSDSLALNELGIAVPSFLPGDDPIPSLNKAMKFLTTAITTRFPPTNNQLRTSSNSRNQATVQEDCDKAPGAKAVVTTNLSSYDSDVISEVPISETNQDNSIPNNMCSRDALF